MQIPESSSNCGFLYHDHRCNLTDSPLILVYADNSFVLGIDNRNTVTIYTLDIGNDSIEIAAIVPNANVLYLTAA